MSSKKNSSTGSMIVGGIIGAAIAVVGAIGLYVLNNDEKKEKAIQDIRRKWRQSHVTATGDRRTVDGQNDGFKCTITQEVMREPVILMNCGHTFEREVILEWISREESCPICRANAQPHHVKPNYALKQAIAESNKTRK